MILTIVLELLLLDGEDDATDLACAVDELNYQGKLTTHTCLPTH